MPSGHVMTHLNPNRTRASPQVIAIDEEDRWARELNDVQVRPS